MHVAIIGATGAVGKELIKVIQTFNFRITNVYLLGSEIPTNTAVTTTYGELPVHPFSTEAVLNPGVFLAFVSVSTEFAVSHLPILAAAGVLCIENSAAFQYDIT